MSHSHLLQLADIIPVDRDQVVVFAFVVVLVALATFRRIQQQKMWHETVRLALEKGQPMPSSMAQGGPFGLYWRYRGNWPLYRGLVLIAVGVGLYLVHYTGANKWAPLPICVGVAMLLIGVFNAFRTPNDSDPQNPANRQ